MSLNKTIQSGDLKLWLDSRVYTINVLNGGNPIPWETVPAAVNLLRQTEQALSLEVVTIDLGEVVESYLQRTGPVQAAMAGKRRTGYAAKQLLADKGLRDHLVELVGALVSSLSAPVVLELPSLAQFVGHCHRFANHLDSIEVIERDADAAAMYWADLLRIFSGSDIAGVCVAGIGDAYFGYACPWDLCQPIANIAKHYGWSCGYKTLNDLAPSDAVPCDYSIGLAAGHPGQVHNNIDWDASEPLAITQSFNYLELPANVEPEVILSRLASFRE